MPLVEGIRDSSLTVTDTTVTLKFTQQVKGSAPAKAPGYVLRIARNFPEHDIVVDFENAYITPSQSKTVAEDLNFLKELGVPNKLTYIFPNALDK